MKLLIKIDHILKIEQNQWK